MATLSISEYSTPPSIAEALQEPAVLRQRVSIDLDPKRSGKFHKSTRLIRIAAEAACWLTIGGDDADPAKDGEYFPAGTVERRGVPEGGAFLVAVVGSNILVVPHALGQRVTFEEGEGPRLDALDGPAALKRLNREIDHTRLEPVYETITRVKRNLST